MDIYALRRAKLTLLVERYAQGNIASFARDYGYSRSQVSQFLSDTYNGGRSIGERVARTIDNKVGMPSGWLDQPLTDVEEKILNNPLSTAELRVATGRARPIDTSRDTQYLRKIPIMSVLAVDESGVTEEPVDVDNVMFLEYYSRHGHHAYQIKGWALKPRLKSGEYIVVSTFEHQMPGDDVVVETQDNKTLIMQFLYQRDGELAFSSLAGTEPMTFLKYTDIKLIEVIIAIVSRNSEVSKRDS